MVTGFAESPDPLDLFDPENKKTGLADPRTQLGAPTFPLAVHPTAP